MDKSVAIRLNELMLRHSADLDRMLAEIEAAGDEEEFVRYRTAIGQIMGAMYLGVMRPLYTEHLDLRPPGLDPQA